jgi:glycosyltransferase involved in cell wall biosynthesis
MPSARIRILHVVGIMDYGGVENWLMHLLRQIDGSRFAFDFLVHLPRAGAYDDEIRHLGSRVIHCPRPSHLWSYSRRLTRILVTNGPYRVVHSHVHLFSGVVLRLAAKTGTPIRVSHSHSDQPGIGPGSGLARRTYVRVARHWLNCFATSGLAASASAATALYGPSWREDPRWSVLCCGVDLAPFRATPVRELTRSELRVPPGAWVLGHVGRFVESKNHVFLLDVFAKLAKQDASAWLLLVGDGPLQNSIRNRAAELGVADRVTFAGPRPDVPRIMCNAMDMFAFPSLSEGLGLALVEAQAAGLPCLVSDRVPAEASVIRPLVRRLSLDDSMEGWVAAAKEMLACRMRPWDATGLVELSPFNLQVSLRELERLYAT